MFTITKRLLIVSITFLVLIGFLVLLGAVQGRDNPSPSDIAVDLHKYSLVRWELEHFSDKWIHKFNDILPWNSEPPREVRIAQAQEFFELKVQLRNLGRDTDSDRSEQISALEQRRWAMQADVEETMESEISSILTQEGFASRIGVIFPPVDVVYADSPTALIISPRNNISQLESTLLKPGLSNKVRDDLEEIIFREDDVSALVVNTGGVATYPSVVSDSMSLHDALIITAHEWLHHWFFFQPLGQHFWDNGDMVTLNETAATIGGQLIGDRAFTAMTGEEVIRKASASVSGVDPDSFDFNAEMRETRLNTEEMLSNGHIVEAETYMEGRRQFMEDNGHFIRKLNQAFFAFYGSYATGVGSVSPIGDQLERLRLESDSIEEFVKTVGGFKRVSDLEEHLGRSLSLSLP